jgi:serine/threonine protein kinase
VNAVGSAGAGGPGVFLDEDAMSDPISDDAVARFVKEHVLATAAQIEAAQAFQEDCARRKTPVSLADALVKIGAITFAQRDTVEQRLQSHQKGGIQQLMHYKLLRKLGEGGMGAVYLAEDTLMERQVAIKVLPKQFSGNTEFMRRFQREADAMGRMHHENIVRAFSVGEDQGRHFIIMEYVEGQTLEKRLRQERVLPADEATRIVIQAARALRYAHEQGVVHRDIKPANIILRPDGVAKILDLGLSKDVENEQSSFLTRSGVAVGTPHYMSPEQARGERDLDGRADIYSLGGTYYHFVTGDTPFHGSSAFEIVTQHINAQLPDPRDLREDVPDGVCHVIRRMMTKRRTDRYRDCGELLEDLERVMEGMDPRSEAVAAVLSSVALPKVARTPRRHFAPKPARPAEAMPSPVPSTPSPAAQVLPALDAAGRRVADSAGRAWGRFGVWAKREGRRAGIRLLRAARAARDKAGPLAAAALARLQTVPPRVFALVGGLVVVAVAALLIQMRSTGPKGPAVAGSGAVSPPERPLPSNDAAGGGRPAPPAIDPGPAVIPVSAPVAPPRPPSDTKALPAAPPAPTVPVPVRPPATMEEWVVFARRLPAEEQVRCVVEKLKELNPGYNGQEMHGVEADQVTRFDLSGAPVRDLNPVRAFAGLQVLWVGGTKVSDLSAVQDLPLRDIRFWSTPVSDLSPLRGKTLSAVHCADTPVSDLSPLSGMPLQFLDCSYTAVDRLPPLGGTTLNVLVVRGSRIADLSSLKSFQLKELVCDLDPPRDGPLLRAIPTLEKINGLPSADFWRTFDEAGAIAQAGASLPEDPAWNNAIDLLPMVEPGLDTLAGAWTVSEGTLVSDRAKDARIAIPFKTPEEYDFRVRFTRREGRGAAVQILSPPAPSLAWLMGDGGNSLLGFTRVGGKEADGNPTGVRMAWCLENGRPYTSVVQVRRDGIAAFLNGRRVAQWAPAAGEAGASPAWALRDASLLGLGSSGSVTAFHAAEILEVTGRGRILRPQPAVTGDGNGLRGAYFVGRSMQDAPILTRIDPVVDFTWDIGAPDEKLPVDAFSVRWEGKVLAQYSEAYTFTAVADDGVRLWIDGKPLIDDWRVTNRRTENSGTIRLKAGTKYDLKMEYFESRGDATARLFWSSPSTRRAILPTSQLFASP